MSILQNIQALRRVFLRECRAILEDGRLRGVVLIAPWIYAALFAAVYSRHSVTGVPVALLQQDFAGPALQLARMVRSSAKLDVKHLPQSVEEMRELFWSGQIDAGLVITNDFSNNLKQGKSSTVTCYVNAASMVSANTAAKALNEIVQTFSAGVEIRVLMKKGDRLIDAKERFNPVRLDLRSLHNPSYNYTNFMVPGLLAAILQQVILLGTALSWAGERERRTLPELFRISRSPAVLLTGKGLPYFLINVAVAEFYLRVLFPMHDIPMQGSWVLAIPFTLLFVFTVVTWGSWVSALAATRLAATQILMFVAMPSFVLSGFTWPAYAMPAWVQALGSCLPLTYFLRGFRNIYMADAPWRFVARDFGIVGAFAVANAGIAYLIIRRWIRREEQASSEPRPQPAPDPVPG